MARLYFTQQFARFMDVPQVNTDAAELRSGLETAFSACPRLRR